MIQRSDFIADAPSSPGEQVRISHGTCGDTRRRLYIKRLTDGTVLAYCHNCGESGFSRSKIRNLIYSFKKPSVASSPKDTRMPKDCIQDTSLWPKEALYWIIKYGITLQEIKDRGISYSPSYDRVVFPLYMDGEYIGWQGRSLDESTNPPKYLTTTDKGRAGGNTATIGTAKVGVVVEDCLSAIKVARQCSTVCLLGSSPTMEIINWISKQYSKVYIWLDNDNKEVKESQLYLYRLLGTLMNGNVELILTDKDPKEHTDEEIKCLLST